MYNTFVSYNETLVVCQHIYYFLNLLWDSLLEHKMPFRREKPHSEILS